jgi:hypothetical protein
MTIKSTYMVYYAQYLPVRKFTVFCVHMYALKGYHTG